MRLGPATPLADILEADWQRDVLSLAKQLQWVAYHTFNSQRSAHGFPDACLVRKGDRHLFIEFKREKTKPTEQQKTWIGLLLSSGAEVYICRPSDLTTIGVILAHRGNPLDKPCEARDAAVYLQEKTRKEVA